MNQSEHFSFFPVYNQYRAHQLQKFIDYMEYGHYLFPIELL